MKIGLSTSVIQRGKTGVAQYVFALLRAFLPYADKHEFNLFVFEEDRPLFDFVSGKMKLIPVAEKFRPAVKNVLWHQRVLPGLAGKLGLDVLHVPSYRRMLWHAPCPLVATIHDLATEVYVLGAVTEPRAVSFKDQVTLSSAIANARGTLPDARLREVVIIRGSLTDPHYAVVNYLDILKGRDPEVALHPRDIVYVPDHPLGLLQDAVKVIEDTFVRTLAANEGIRAGGGTGNVNVGVTVGQ